MPEQEKNWEVVFLGQSGRVLFRERFTSEQLADAEINKVKAPGATFAQVGSKFFRVASIDVMEKNDKTPPPE